MNCLHNISSGEAHTHALMEGVTVISFFYAARLLQFVSINNIIFTSQYILLSLLPLEKSFNFTL